MKIMFEELNLPLSNKDANSIELFKYLHQTHREFDFPMKNSEEEKSAFEAIERYNEEYRSITMKHYLCSRMLYFVYKNYLHVY